MPQVTHFRSGANRATDLRGTIRAGEAVGVVATMLSRECLDILAQALTRGVPVFVDSGAFGEISSGRQPDWDAVFTIGSQEARSFRAGRNGVARKFLVMARV